MTDTSLVANPPKASKNINVQATSVVKESFETYKRIKSSYTTEQLDYIIKSVAPTLNRDEAIIFIIRCEKLQIDPMSGDITAYVQISKKDNSRKLTMIVARNWKRERGMDNQHVKSIKNEAIYVKEDLIVSKQLDGDNKTVTENQTKRLMRVQPWEGGNLWGAMCTIVRDDYAEPFVVVAPLAEYKGWNVWESKPSTMIKKVAESQCWDMAVPELSRVYDEAERFDNPTQAPVVEGGSEPATPEQIKTIEALLKDKDEVTKSQYNLENISKQDAVNAIKELSTKK